MSRVTVNRSVKHSRAHLCWPVLPLIALAACQNSPPPPPPPPITGTAPLHLTNGNGPSFTANVLFAPGGGGGAGKRSWSYTVFNAPAGKTQDGGISSVTIHTPKDVSKCTVASITPTTFSATFPTNQDIKVSITTPVAGYIGDSVVTFTVTCDMTNVSDDILIEGFDWASKATGKTSFSLAGPEGTT